MKTTNQRQPYAEGHCSVCGEYTKFGKLTGRGLECPKECPQIIQSGKEAQCPKKTKRQ